MKITKKPMPIDGVELDMVYHRKHISRNIVRRQSKYIKKAMNRRFRRRYKKGIKNENS